MTATSIDPAEWLSIMLGLGNLVPLVAMHLWRTIGRSEKRPKGYVFVLCVYTYFLGWYFHELLFQSSPQEQHLPSATLMLAAYLFIVMSEILRSGLARKLTEWRGERWVNEVDYFYLVPGLIGLAMCTRFVGVGHETVSSAGMLGPLLVSSAIAIRALKTRVETNDWNKLRPLPADADPVGQAHFPNRGR